jgi:hypothetical protein
VAGKPRELLYGGSAVSDVTYRHSGIGPVRAVRASGRPHNADWEAVADAFDGRLIGCVVDTRADSGGGPSEIMPGNEDAKPYDSFGMCGQFITSTHSLRWALLAIGNHEAKQAGHISLPVL